VAVLRPELHLYIDDRNSITKDNPDPALEVKLAKSGLLPIYIKSMTWASDEHSDLLYSYGALTMHPTKHTWRYVPQSDRRHLMLQRWMFKKEASLLRIGPNGIGAHFLNWPRDFARDTDQSRMHLKIGYSYFGSWPMNKWIVHKNLTPKNGWVNPFQ